MCHQQVPELSHGLSAIVTFNYSSGAMPLQKGPQMGDRGGRSIPHLWLAHLARSREDGFAAWNETLSTSDGDHDSAATRPAPSATFLVFEHLSVCVCVCCSLCIHNPPRVSDNHNWSEQWKYTDLWHEAVRIYIWSVCKVEDFNGVKETSLSPCRFLWPSSLKTSSFLRCGIVLPDVQSDFLHVILPVRSLRRGTTSCGQMFVGCHRRKVNWLHEGSVYLNNAPKRKG